MSPGFFDREDGFTRIGRGELGGKARGLVFFGSMLEAELDPAEFPQFEVGVPGFAVIASDHFDTFVRDNDLEGVGRSDLPDVEVARAFQRASLPDPVTAYLDELVRNVDVPLAVRSSSLLEDAIFSPFAGVYATKMIPNNQPDAAERARKLAEAVKLVYSSTFSSNARSHLRATGHPPESEKMPVIIQEIVGTPHGRRFYPNLSGVGRSFNYYPAAGSRPEDGVVMLALGLGKTIADGDPCWAYSPGRPQAPPPYGSVDELMHDSQLEFWSVNLGAAGTEDPIAEDEHLIRADLGAAEEDGSLRHVASTYDAGRDRLVPGTGVHGPRVLTFAPLLVGRTLPLNDLVRSLLSACERASGSEVDTEFAVTLPRDDSEPARLGFLQVRPMVAARERVEIRDDEWNHPHALLASEQVMGHGIVDGIRDVVYVKPERFEARHTRRIADELTRLNGPLVAEKRPYLLIGFGRWGSADPWLGIPVEWGQISGAKVIVEAMGAQLNVEPSQGAHFFHNLCSFGVSYLATSGKATRGIDWDWLDHQPAVSETDFVRHARCEQPLSVKVDGRNRRGVIWRAGSERAPGATPGSESRRPGRPRSSRPEHS